jgi:hypothetical protein
VRTNLNSFRPRRSVLTILPRADMTALTDEQAFAEVSLLAFKGLEGKFC